MWCMNYPTLSYEKLYLKANISHKSVHFLHDTFVIATGHGLVLVLNHRFVDYHRKLLRRTLAVTEFCSKFDHDHDSSSRGKGLSMKICRTCIHNFSSKHVSAQEAVTFNVQLSYSPRSNYFTIIG